MRAARTIPLVVLALLLLPAFVPQPSATPVPGPAADLRALAASGETRLLLSFHSPPSAADEAALAGVARTLEDFPFAGVRLVEVRPGTHTALAKIGIVAGAYPEERIRLLLASSTAAVRADEAWTEHEARGLDVGIAVVDSGVDSGHPGLSGRVAASVRVGSDGVSTASGDADEHGTHVAGVAAGSGQGSSGFRHRGVAPEARIVGVDISGSFTTTNAIRAFQWIHEHHDEHGIRVVTNSWGRDKPTAAYDPDDPVTRAADALVADGLLVLFSAGNGGAGGGRLTVEAMNPNVLTVGATDDTGRVESYSAEGPAYDRGGNRLSEVKPDLVAPGTSITSIRAGGRGSEERDLNVTLNGTSMAAPHVAGVAA
ncbi:MAG: S8 family serine peptidase, partial [Methanobacteriota archaeon]